MNEVELLFTEILNCNRSSLYLNRDLRLDKNKSSLISSALKRRAFGEPIQYILGRTEFMGLEFKVNSSVFIPRPETEILVEAVIDIVRSSEFGVRRILDIGTGSGCIAVSLAKFLPNVELDAVDISYDALEVAKYNAKLNNIDDKIRFIKSDLFTNYQLPITNYDMIISNPPYIPRGDIKNLPIEVQWEPRIALDGGKDGSDFYRRIIRESPRYIKKEGLLIMEMGFNQREDIKNIFQKTENYKIIDIIKDYSNIERVIVVRRYG